MEDKLANWFEPKSHYLAQGDVDASGKMTKAEVTNNHGQLIDRDAKFESESDFVRWARKKAGV